jgi:protein-disulfide isomerase
VEKAKDNRRNALRDCQFRVSSVTSVTSVVNGFPEQHEPLRSRRFTEDCNRLLSSVLRTCLFLLAAVALLAADHADAQSRGGGISLAGVGHDLGGAAARVFIVEFGDFGCSYCAKFNVETYPKIDSAYIKAGVVRWKMVPFVTGMFRNSREVAEAAECAAEQGAFWKMHDLLYTKRKEWMASTEIGPLVTRYATQLKLDRTVFARCVLNPEIRRRIQRNDAIAQQLGIRGTPMFYVNGRSVPGAIPFELFQQVITAASR